MGKIVIIAVMTAVTTMSTIYCTFTMWVFRSSGKQILRCVRDTPGTTMSIKKREKRELGRESLQSGTGIWIPGKKAERKLD